MREFEAPKAGQKFKAQDLADWLAETRRLGKWTVDGGTLSVSPTGMHLSIDRDGGFWARLSGRDFGFYSWEEVEFKSDGSGWYTSPSGRVGHFDGDAAVEINGAQDVPADTIVYLYPAIVGDLKTSPYGNDFLPQYYLFDRCRTSAQAECVTIVTDIRCNYGQLQVTKKALMFPPGMGIQVLDAICE